MITFALDTATISPSVALVRDEVPLAELWLGAEPGSGRRVLEAGHGLLSAAGLDAGDIGAIVVGVGPGGFTGLRIGLATALGLGADAGDIGAIVVGVGPGGFTGLRIGLATALGLGQALDVPVRGAVSLEALALGIAQTAPGHDVVVPVLDARRRELFAAAYRPGPDGGLEELIAPCAIAPTELAERLQGVTGDAVVGGPGCDAAGDALLRPGISVLEAGSPGHRMRAALLSARVAAGAGRPARPVYARLPDAEVNRRAAAAAAG